MSKSQALKALILDFLELFIEKSILFLLGSSIFLKGLECIVNYLPELHDELIKLVVPLMHHKKKVIQKAAKSLLNVLNSE